MLRLVLADLWVDIRKYWLPILVWSFAAVFFINFIIIVNIQGQLMQQLNASGLTEIAQADRVAATRRIAAGLMEEYGNRSAAVIWIGVLLLIWKFSGWFPMRLNRGLFVCPAGRKEKERYLTLQLGIHMLLAVAYAAWFGGSYFLQDSALLNVMNFTFFLCSVLVMHLKIWIVGKPDYLAENVRSTTEIKVNLYWMTFIILADVVFYGALFAKQAGHPLIVCLWILFLAANIICCKRLWKPLTDRALSYETAYGRERTL